MCIQIRKSVKSAAAALILICGLAPEAQSQPSPVGTWDFVFGGTREGLAYITFYSNFTFDGFEIVVPAKDKKKKEKNKDQDSDTGRGADEDTGRTPATSSTGGTGDTGANGGTAITNLFGFTDLSGPWAFDNKGKVIGFFTEVTEGVCTTNIVVTTITTTNGGTVITEYFTNTVESCSGTTNAVSFVGKVVPGKRFTIVGSSARGKIDFKGVPFKLLSDISGPWYATKKVNKQKFIEFFELEASGFPNIYLVTDGMGPGYGYEGAAILSAQKKIAFGTSEGNGTNIVAVVGSFNAKKVSAKTTGVDGRLNDQNNRISFDATRQ